VALDLNDLSKEQKQALFLIVLLVIAGVYALYRFVLMPTLGTFKDSGNEAEELETKLARADAAVSQQKKIRADLLRSTEEMTELNEKYLPPLGNALSWATERIYRDARRVGVDVASVSPSAMTSVPWERDMPGKKKQKQTRVFVPFGVRISAKCGYFDLVRFIELMEQNNPYVCVDSLVVSVQTQDPQVHDVSMTLQWPIWKTGTGPEDIREIKEPGTPPTANGAPADRPPA